jgi:hypothetical protein
VDIVATTLPTGDRSRKIAGDQTIGILDPESGGEDPHPCFFDGAHYVIESLRHAIGDSILKELFPMRNGTPQAW